MALRAYASRVRVFFFLFLIIGGACATSAFKSTATNDPPKAKSADNASELSSAENELYALVNQERKDRNLPLFTVDNHLVAAARFGWESHRWQRLRAGGR